MIKIFSKKTALIAGAILAVSLMSSQSWATSLKLIPDAMTIHSGDLVNVVVQLEGLDATLDVSAIDFDVNFDPNVITFDSYILTDQLGTVNVDAVDMSGLKSPGCFNLAELSLLSWNGISLPAQDEPLTLATISFIGKNKGISDLSFTLLPLDNSILDYYGNGISVSTSTASITNVPEPSTIMLYLSGLLSLLGLGAFRKKVN